MLCILEAVQGASRTALCGRDAGGYASCAGGMEIGSSGDSLQVCRLYRMGLRSSGGVLRVGVEEWSSGGVCKCVDVEVERYKCAAGVLPQEVLVTRADAR